MLGDLWPLNPSWYSFLFCWIPSFENLRVSGPDSDYWRKVLGSFMFFSGWGALQNSGPFHNPNLSLHCIHGLFTSGDKTPFTVHCTNALGVEWGQSCRVKFQNMLESLAIKAAMFLEWDVQQSHLGLMFGVLHIFLTMRHVCVCSLDVCSNISACTCHTLRHEYRREMQGHVAQEI